MKFNFKRQISHDDRYPYKCTPQEWGEKRIPEIFQAVTTVIPWKILSWMYDFRGKFLSGSLFFFS